MLRRAKLAVASIGDTLSLLRLRALGISVGSQTKVAGMPLVSMEPGSKITIGDRVVLCSRSESTALGVAHPVILRTLRTGAQITVGNDTGISGGVICAAQSVVIGDHCLFGADVIVADTDFHPISPVGRRYASPSAAKTAPVVIGSNVFVGTRSVILKGVTVGDNTVIGAGSVVTNDLPSDCVAAGNPCRVLHRLG